VSSARDAGAPAPGAEGLVCPQCKRAYPASERFCASCGMPLVHRSGGEEEPSARRRRARKIKPQYAEGQLVKVARAQHQSEAEFIEGLLLEEGIPSILQPLAAIVAPYAPVAAPRAVLVPESAAEAAREALAWNAPA